MTPAEFRELLKESVRLELNTISVGYGDEGQYLEIKLVSTEPNSSFNPEEILREIVYLPTRT